MKLTKTDWDRLKTLRDRFLHDASENYWSTQRDLELYDLVFAARIGWKWNAVLDSLTRTGWKPQSDKIIDWGCGTGVASRQVTEWSGIQQVTLVDQSPLALDFAQQQLSKSSIVTQVQSPGSSFVPKSLLLLSHVLGELSDAEAEALAHQASLVDEIIWVEPGSHDISRKLSQVRSIFLEAGHHLIAPCTHALPCPMLQARQERHWCHFFATPPTEIFQSAFWNEASHQLGIDLRSLPYSYLAFSRYHSPSWPADTERLIGHARSYKGYGKLFCCGASGLHERTLQKRENPDLFKKLIKHQEEGVFTWQLRESQYITEGKAT
ncbi:MAG: small ribosomal subunit Rsm22 family protein [Chthoniobacterales bacterium]|nr:small ribosomal subunit Rsm22 family protein [Chthoniobacterales bacterium]